MKIERSKLIDALAAFATSTGGLVTGRPGVGKTYSVWQCDARLRASGFYVLIVPVDRMEMQDATDFQRLMGFRRNWLDEIRAEIIDTERKRGVIIFDAYDAARDDRKRDLVLSLIQQSRVELYDISTTVVAVREFDADKSPRLRKLFTDNGAKAPRFTIPPLDDEEFGRAVPQVLGLAEIYASAGRELRGLLHIPFFLWLVQRVWRDATDTTRFAGITSEVQMLRLLWETRVSGDEHGTARDMLARSIARTMVEQRRLELSDPTVYRPEYDWIWRDLQSAEIITLDESRGWLVRFSHNILFDYAVSRLFDGLDSAGLEKFFSGNRALPLFVRPSLTYYFAELWHTQRMRFWAIFTESVQQHLDGSNPITRLIIPNIVINETQSATDLGPWLSELRRASVAGIRGTVFLLQAHRVIRPGRILPWAEIIVSISETPHWDFSWDACIVTDWLLTEGRRSESAAIPLCGIAGRNLLRWCWQRRSENLHRNDQLAGAWLIPLVGKTYATDLKESRALLEPVLRVMDEPGFPVDCIYRLCNEIRTIASVDPEFAQQIYVRVFGYRETSREPTNIGSSVVLPLISNRRQDYEMCHYILGQEFPRFLEAHPAVATATALQSLNVYIRAVHVVPFLKRGASEDDVTWHFGFGERTLTLIEDMSRIWDETVYPDQPMVLAFELKRFLLQEADLEDRERLYAIFNAYLDNAQVAAMWRRLFDVATSKSEVFTPLLKGFFLIPALQASADLIHPLGRFLTAAVPFLTNEDIRAIEMSLLDLCKRPPFTSKFTRHCRDRLIYCLPAARLQTKVARTLRTKLARQEHPPENRPLVQFSSSSRPYSTADWLAESKVDVAQPRNETLWRLLLEFEKDEAKWREANPTTEAWRGRMSAAMALWKEANNVSADALLTGNAQTKASAFAVAAVQRMPSPTTEEWRLLRDILLAAAAHKQPKPELNEDLTWTSTGWSPTPRTEAASGLLFLFVKTGNAEALDAVQKLAADKVPLIRFLVASELWRLRDVARPQMQELLQERLTVEPNTSVIEALALSVHNSLSVKLPESVALARDLAERAMSDTAPQSYHNDVAAMVTDLVLVADTDWAVALATKWQSDPANYAVWIVQCAARTQLYIVPANQETSFARAIKLQQANIGAAARGIASVQPTPPVADFKEAEKAVVRKLYTSINDVVTRLYFALDIEHRRNDEPVSDEPTRRTFYFAIKPILDSVIAFGSDRKAGAMLGPTAHYFMQLLNAAVAFDTKGALHYAAAIASASKPYGYNLDHLAVKEVVALVETVLADHRLEVHDDTAFNDLLALLDAFTEVGWPDALALVWRLDEIYR
jgi:hypothetical protein